MNCNKCKILDPQNCQGFSVGDSITVKEPRTFTTSWREKVTINPGDIFTIVSFAPKIYMIKGPGYDNKQCFVYAISPDRKYRTGSQNPVELRANFCAIRKVATK
jgi:hypothetical protein